MGRHAPDNPCSQAFALDVSWPTRRSKQCDRGASNPHATVLAQQSSKHCRRCKCRACCSGAPITKPVGHVLLLLLLLLHTIAPANSACAGSNLGSQAWACPRSAVQCQGTRCAYMSVLGVSCTQPNHISMPVVSPAAECAVGAVPRDVGEQCHVTWESSGMVHQCTRLSSCQVAHCRPTLLLL